MPLLRRQAGGVRVVLHNTDGVNPYGVEVAALLARDPLLDVVLVDAANGEHQPPERVRWRRVLPGNYVDTTPLRQAGAVLRGLAVTVSAGVRGHVIVIAWYRWSVEALAFAALAARGVPVVYIDHNPVPRIRESWLTRTARRSLLRRARVVVVHAERLRALVDPVARGRIAVCPHPPYVQTAPHSVEPSDELAGDRRWLAFIGRMRRDKGVHLLPEVLARVPAERRRELGLVLCGMGTVPDEVRERLLELDVTLRELVTKEPIPQETLHAVLAARPLVLAPYVAATQSGSVILALSMGCNVLAFDKGGIPDVVAAEGLVPINDLDAFAAALSTAQGGPAVLALDEWADQAAGEWSRIVRSAAGTSEP